jgi:excisionase family DNA binding protein
VLAPLAKVIVISSSDDRQPDVDVVARSSVASGILSAITMNDVEDGESHRRNGEVEPSGDGVIEIAAPRKSRRAEVRPRARRRKDSVASDTADVGSPWLNADQAAKYLALPSAKAIYEAVRRGEIPAHRLGERRLRFRRDELDALLDSRLIGGNLSDVLFSGGETPRMPTGRR